jgi:hypothetical protein
MGLAACCGVALVCGVASGAPWTSNGPTGGIVNAVAVDPTVPTTVYAGTNGGGFFKSLDGGVTWSPISTGVANVAGTVVSGLAVDPVTPARLYATASAGVNAGGFTQNGGFSVYESTDAGANWASTPIEVLVEALALAPGTLLAGTLDGGMWRSTDGASTWNEANTGLVNTVVNELAVDATPGAVYSGTTRQGVVRSTDGGGTWTPTAFLGTFDAIRALAADPSTPGTVYAGTTLSGAFKSTDGGGAWAPAAGGTPPFNVEALLVDPRPPTSSTPLASAASSAARPAAPTGRP